MLLGVHMLPREHLQQHEAEGRAHRCWLAQRGRTEGVPRWGGGRVSAAPTSLQQEKPKLQL